MKLAAAMILLGLATAVSTLVGGWLALSLQRRGPLLRAFSTGAVIGVAVLDLLPEALRTAGGAAAAAWMLAYAAAGFLAYLFVDRALSAAFGAASAHRGHLGPGGLTIHSVLDGLTIGLALRASSAVGFMVAAAVIAHDVSDGVNTVNLSLSGGSRRAVALRWLVADAAAPIVGMCVAGFLRVGVNELSPLLATLAGMLLYVGVGKFAHEGPLRAPARPAMLAATLGFGFIFAVGRMLQA